MKSIIKSAGAFLAINLFLVLTPCLQAQTVDAAVYTLGHAYFFQGNQYYRFTGTKVDAGYPRTLPGGWEGLPANFQKGIDAALFYPPNEKTYFFKGNQYVRLTGTKVDNGYPANLPGGWSGLPASFANGIDAAVFAEGHTYFFKGNQYVRFTGTKMDSGYPKPLPGGWEMPSSFQSGIGAALDFPPNGKNYLFKGDQYIRLTNFKMDGGYPANLPGGWEGLGGKTGNGANNYPVRAAVPACASINQLEGYPVSWKLIWHDRGSGATKNVSIWRPEGRQDEINLGDHASGEYAKPYGFATVFKDDPILFARPLDFRQVWNDKETGSDLDGAFWSPICPARYVALGHIATRTWEKPDPQTLRFRCVCEDMVEKTTYREEVWNDRASGGKYNLSIYGVTGYKDYDAPRPSKHIYFKGGNAYETQPNEQAWRLKIPVKEQSRARPSATEIIPVLSGEVPDRTSSQLRNTKLLVQRNRFPYKGDTCKGFPLEHIQAVATLPDRGNGKTYWIITASQHWGGWLAVIESDGAAPSSSSAQVVWFTQYDQSNPAGPYNHPGDVEIVGNTLVVALQNWEGSPGPPKFCALHRPDNRKNDAVAFYDLSNPLSPRYKGKLDAVDFYGHPGEVSSISFFLAGSNQYVLGVHGLYFLSEYGPEPNPLFWGRVHKPQNDEIAAGSGNYTKNGNYFTASVYYNAPNDGMSDWMIMCTSSRVSIRPNSWTINGEMVDLHPGRKACTFKTRWVEKGGYDVGLLGEVGLADSKSLGPSFSVDSRGKVMISFVGPFFENPYTMEVVWVED